MFYEYGGNYNVCQIKTNVRDLEPKCQDVRSMEHTREFFRESSIINTHSTLHKFIRTCLIKDFIDQPLMPNPTMIRYKNDAYVVFSNVEQKRVQPKNESVGSDKQDDVAENKHDQKQVNEEAYSIVMHKWGGST